MIAFVLTEKEMCRDILNLGYSSYNDINIFDKKLSYYQDLCLEFGDEIKKIYIKNNEVNVIKRALHGEKDGYSVFFFDNCFFDFSISDFFKKCDNINDFSVSFYDEKDNLIVALASNKKLSQFLSNSFSTDNVTELLKPYKSMDLDDFYYKFIDSYNSYKELCFDILSNKTNVLLPSIANGIYTDGKLPEGDYTIIPPVYISQNSQIENGAVIGSKSVILSGSLVACNSYIVKSVLCENTYVSNDCYIENSLCGRNVSIKRGAAVLSGCVLGFNSILGDDYLIENGAILLPETRAGNVKKEFNFVFESDNDSGCIFDIDVVTAVKLGVGFGKVFSCPSVCVGCDDSLDLSCIKLALISGLNAVGCDCFDVGTSFLSKSFYTMKFCQLDYCLFLSFDKNSATLKVFDSDFNPLKNTDFFNLIYALNAFRNEKIDSQNTRKIKQIKGIGKLYLRDLKNILPDNIFNSYSVECSDSVINKIVMNNVKIKSNFNTKKQHLVFKINQNGTELKLNYNGRDYSHFQLLETLKFLDDTSEYDQLIFSLIKVDALVLLFKIISFFEEDEDNLSLFLNNLENYNLIEGEITFIKRTGKFVGELFNKNLEYKDGKIYIINKNECFDFKLNPTRKSLKLVAKSFNNENAEEICKNLYELFDDINNV